MESQQIAQDVEPSPFASSRNTVECRVRNEEAIAETADGKITLTDHLNSQLLKAFQTSLAADEDQFLAFQKKTTGATGGGADSDGSERSDYSDDAWDP